MTSIEKRLLVFLWLGVSALLFFPVLFSLNQSAIGSKELDLPAQLWNLWWQNQPNSSQLVNFPIGVSEFYSLTPIHDFLSILLAPNIIMAHNLVSLLGFSLCFFSGALLGLRYGNDRESPFLGALLLSLSVPMQAALLDGTGEFIWLGALVFFVLFLDKDHPSKGYFLVGSSALLALNLFLCWYYGAAALLFLVLWSLWNRKYWGLLSVVLGLGLSYTFISNFMNSPFEPDKSSSSLLLHILHGGNTPVVDAELAHLPIAQKWQLSLRIPALLSPWFWVLALLCIRSLRGNIRRHRFYLLAIATSFLIALGSYTGSGLPLPMLWINRFLQYYGIEMHLPMHLSSLGIIALIIIALQDSFHPKMLLTALLLHLILIAPMESWTPDRSSFWTEIDRPIFHYEEIDSHDLAALNRVIELQLQHGQSIASFPIFPTNLVHHQGVDLVEKSQYNPSELLGLGYGYVSIPKGRKDYPSWKENLDQCCLWKEHEDIWLYQLDLLFSP